MKLGYNGAIAKWESIPSGFTLWYDGATTIWIGSDGRNMKYKGEIAAFLINGNIPLRFKGERSRWESDDGKIIAWFVGEENVWMISEDGTLPPPPPTKASVRFVILDSNTAVQSSIDGSTGNTLTVDGTTVTFNGRYVEKDIDYGTHDVVIMVAGVQYAHGSFTV